MSITRQASFFDFFARPNQDNPTTPYENLLRAPASQADGGDVDKYQTLFAEAFGHHVQFYLNTPPELTIASSNKRLIESDGLTTYFLEKIYTPPAFYETSNYPPEDEDRRSYDYFLERILENPDTSGHGGEASEGSNLVTFLIGDVGAGKTLLLCKVFRDILRNQANAIRADERGGNSKASSCVVPVYFDFETKMKSGASGGQLKDIGESFYIELFAEIESSLRRAQYAVERINFTYLQSIAAFAPRTSLEELIKYLHSRGIRLILFFDNIDGYHYYYSKYTFFARFYAEQVESIRKNITNLINIFTHGQYLGTRALSVVFAARMSVYRDCRHLTEPEASAGFSGATFQIETATGDQVVGARLDLFEHAIRTIVNNPDTNKLGKQYQAILPQLYTMLGIPEARNLLRTATSTAAAITSISRLGHHGNRSLVAFLSNLRLDHRLDGALFKRFFTDKPHTLVLLYLANLRERYSQAKKHFPNLFLVDAKVMQEPHFLAAHRGHLHTYWLKYLTLALVFRAKDGVMNTNTIRRIMHNEGEFEEELVNLTIGSLSTSRESRCLEPEGGEPNSTPTRVIMTDRGRYLLAAHHGSTTAFCFSFTYLQLVVDDYLMSYPKEMLDEVYSRDVSLKYLCQDDRVYSREVIRYLDAKMHNVLALMTLLKVAWRSEKRRRPKLFHELSIRCQSCLPEFSQLEQSLMDQYGRILSNMEAGDRLMSRLRLYHAGLRDREAGLSKRLSEYYDSGCMVEE